MLLPCTAPLARRGDDQTCKATFGAVMFIIFTRGFSRDALNLRLGPSAEFDNQNRAQSTH